VSQSVSTVVENSQATFEDAPLPHGWRWMRLGDMSEVISKGTTPTTLGYAFTTSGVPFLRAEDVDGGAVDVTQVAYHISKETHETLSRSQLRSGDLLITIAGTLGRVGYIPYDSPPLNCNQAVAFARLKPKTVDVEYACFACQSQQVLRSLTDLRAGGIIQNLNLQQVQSFLIPLPPLPEQKRIASILKEKMAAVERARAAAEAQLKAAKDLPAAYLREVFDSQEAQQWAKDKLGNVSLISGGIQKTPDRKPKNFHRPYLTVRNVQRGYLDLSALERFEITESELDRLRLMQGDILIVEGNGSLDHIGRNALFRGGLPECIHQNHIIRVRLDEQRFIPEFVSRFLNSDAGKSQMIQKAMTTSGLYTLSAGKVAALEIPMPSMRRQREIVGILSEKIPTAENASGVIKSQLETIGNLPAALLRQAFTGKL
jgi:type I restriction enzyme, S subunit